MSSLRTPLCNRHLLFVLLSMNVGGFIILPVLALNLLRHVASAPAPGAQDIMHYMMFDQQPAWLGAYSVVVMLLSLILGRRSIAAESPVEAGRATWQRIRLGPTAAFAPFFLWQVWVMVGRLASGQWQGSDWMIALSILAMAAMVGITWVWRPSPESLYALVTGDRTRLNDERYLEVQGKAAYLTIVIFVWVLLTGGMLYETMVLRTWPVLTGALILILVLISAITNAYYSRRL